jgi:hypothetical protein
MHDFVVIARNPRHFLPLGINMFLIAAAVASARNRR